MRHIKIFAAAFSNWKRNLSLVAAETITDHVGMPSVRAFTKIFLRATSGEETNKAASDLFAQLDIKHRDVGQRLSILSTSRTLVGWHGMPLTT